MIEKLQKNTFILFGIIMLGGLLHTLIMDGSNGKGITIHLHSNNLLVSHSLPTVKKVIKAVPSYITHKNFIQTSIQTRVIYSYRTKLLADLIQQRYGSVNKNKALVIAQAINKATKGMAWPTPLAVASIIEIESQYHMAAVSSCGAKGLMQISPLWGNKIPQSAYTNIPMNIKYGVSILHYYYQKYDGNKMAAILAYNSGDAAYNAGHAWPVYWWRYKSAHIAFNRLYAMNT